MWHSKVRIWFCYCSGRSRCCSVGSCHLPQAWQKKKKNILWFAIFRYWLQSLFLSRNIDSPLCYSWTSLCFSSFLQGSVPYFISVAMTQKPLCMTMAAQNMDSSRSIINSGAETTRSSQRTSVASPVTVSNLFSCVFLEPSLG